MTAQRRRTNANRLAATAAVDACDALRCRPGRRRLALRARRGTELGGPNIGQMAATRAPRPGLRSSRSGGRSRSTLFGVELGQANGPLAGRGHGSRQRPGPDTQSRLCRCRLCVALATAIESAARKRGGPSR